MKGRRGGTGKAKGSAIDEKEGEGNWIGAPYRRKIIHRTGSDQEIGSWRPLATHHMYSSPNVVAPPFKPPHRQKHAQAVAYDDY
jgi:hypothetical protein